MACPLSPPTVRYPVAPSAALAAGLGALWLLGAALLLAWALQPQAGAWRQAAALCAASAAAAGLLRGWRLLARGHLAWDGMQWWLHEQDAREVAALASLHVWADGGGWLWVQARPAVRDPGGRWLLLAANQIPQTWGELRRAVYFPARLTDPPQ